MKHLFLTGPKGVGKRTLARKFAASEFGIETESSLLYARSDPASLLLGAKPRLISEWQMAPDIWNYIKKDLDREFSFRQYIVTQSTYPAEPEIIMHSGAGRMAALELGTATLYDANESLSLISLQDFLEGKADVPLLGPDDNPMTLPLEYRYSSNSRRHPQGNGCEPARRHPRLVLPIPSSGTCRPDVRNGNRDGWSRG